MSTLIEIGIIDNGEPTIAGQLELVHGKVEVHAAKGFEIMFESLLSSPVIVDGGKSRIFLKENPEAWFAALPANCSGAYVHAHFLN